MPSQCETHKKDYSPPKLDTLTPEQANQSLIGHTSCGDQGAQDLCHVVYPPHGPEGDEDLRVLFDEEEPAPVALQFAVYVGGTILAAWFVGCGLAVLAK